MRSSVSAAALLLAGCGGAPQLAASAPARPSSAATYDRVGHASWYGEELAGRPTASGARFDPAAITAAHRTLPLSSHAEVTSLDTGLTILVLINDRGPGRADRLLDLSRGAAALLGVGASPIAAVRVRAIAASPADRAALAKGEPAARRPIMSASMLAMFRRQLPATARSLAAPDRPSLVQNGRYIVQVAAFSNRARARALAERLGGEAVAIDGIHRVRLGPFKGAVAAERARDAVARHGYGDARIISFTSITERP